MAMSEEVPSFFKVLATLDFTKQLRLPPSFLTEYDLNLPETVKLRADDDSGRSWSVRVERLSDGLVSFTDGWPKFADDAALRLGEFLVFFLLPCSNFNVVIYGTSFLQREIPLPTPSSPLVHHNVGQVAESSKRGRGHPSSSKRKRWRPSSRKRKQGTPSQPYFEALLKDYQKSRMNIPVGFALASNMKAKKKVEMVFEGNNHRVSVAVDHQPLKTGNRVDLAKGWPEFRRAYLSYRRWYRFDFNPNDQVIYVKRIVRQNKGFSA
ncbi:hypothetical protein AAHA92_27615 [Salvia divinorum]|uniref:TF-B3 domain-containing protein n=1 Tax=Salvia divinorum TaxID=28513 RepID=A0ABD1G495_SALDI